jgi:TniQ protein
VHAVQIADPAWETTFPHRVAPRSEEWLAGVLLRCDEANGWDSGRTIAYLLHTLHRPANLSQLALVLPPSPAFLQVLASWLAVPESTLLATTYGAELTRLYERPDPPIEDMRYSFHFCPECLAEMRMLRRTFVLPHITCCPLHHVQLQGTCGCREGKSPPKSDFPKSDYPMVDAMLKMIHEVGVGQELFFPGKKPFTCRECGLDWAQCPRRAADPERLLLERKILAWYDFFFSKGTRVVLQRTLQVINQTLKQRQKKYVERLNGKTSRVTLSALERMSLGQLVDVLVSLELAPDAVETDETPLLWRPVGRQTFYCPMASCPYMKPGNLTAEPSGHHVGSFPSAEETTHAPGADS